MLKDAAVVFAKPLTRIVNESLSQGTVPSEWKYAKTTPLFKKGLSTDMDNYRPISVLPVVSKLLERIVHHQLHSFLSEHKLLNPYQCGFRRNHSTKFAAIAFLDYIRRRMDLGLLTGAVFIDLRKAFDSVDHEILRRETHALNLVKKCLNKHCPQFLMDYFSFNRDIVQRKTLQSNHLRFPSIKLECTKEAFHYHGCEVFNRNL